MDDDFLHELVLTAGSEGNDLLQVFQNQLLQDHRADGMSLTAEVTALSVAGASQNVIDLFLIAKKEQRSVKAKSLSAALSDVRLCGHASGFAAWPYVSRLLLAAPEEGHDLRSGAIRIGAECRAGGSLGDVLLDRPQYRISIVGG